MEIMNPNEPESVTITDQDTEVTVIVQSNLIETTRRTITESFRQMRYGMTDYIKRPPYIPSLGLGLVSVRGALIDAIDRHH